MEPKLVRLGHAQLKYLRYVRRFRSVICPLRKQPILDSQPKPPERPEREFHLRSGLTVIYRPFRPLDGPQVSRIFLENFAPHREEMGENAWQRGVAGAYSVESLPAFAEERNLHVAAKPDGTVLGMTSAVRYSGAYAEFMNLSVDKKARGMGAGKLLAALNVLQMAGEGIKTIYAFAAPQSQGIFLQMGFAESSSFARLVFRGTALSLSAKVNDSFVMKVREMLSGILAPGEERTAAGKEVAT
jgi:L-amino acid N-acyltransferase YncA